jgi:hypothetical protein
MAEERAEDRMGKMMGGILSIVMMVYMFQMLQSILGRFAYGAPRGAITVSDNFDDNSLNTTIWETLVYGGSISEENQKIKFNLTTSSGRGCLKTKSKYDISRGATLYCDLTLGDLLTISLDLCTNVPTDLYEEPDEYYRLAISSDNVFRVWRKRAGEEAGSLVYNIGGQPTSLRAKIIFSGNTIKFYWGEVLMYEETYVLSSKEHYATIRTWASAENTGSAYADNFCLSVS